MKPFAALALPLIAILVLPGCCCCCGGGGGGGGGNYNSGGGSSSGSSELEDQAAEELLEGLFEVATGGQMELDEDGGSIKLSGPDGGIDLNFGDAAGYPADLPIPQYPGSQSIASISIAEPGKDALSTVSMMTTDDEATVSSWYAKQMKGMTDYKLETLGDGNSKSPVHTATMSDGRKLVVSVTTEDASTVIAIVVGED